MKFRTNQNDTGFFDRFKRKDESRYIINDSPAYDLRQSNKLRTTINIQILKTRCMPTRIINPIIYMTF
jgi:hypothetical protein